MPIALGLVNGSKRVYFNGMVMTPLQSRMARAAATLSIPQLAALSKVRPSTVSHFERGGESYASTIAKLQAALEGAGVVFVGAGEASLGGGAGVRLRDLG